MREMEKLDILRIQDKQFQLFCRKEVISQTQLES